ncbi:CHAT domain-containing protein [Coleofasciculus sp. LEGE 07092]|uniref:CHAT domain-containing protein n=2 Tax=unclassified Coleofasciculus TaxID=2692782 RepID=UPI001881D269|nr:CHAT domain-containing protein [Coleofasciculus sp. LEGE 07092]MBE9149715.1 CHAT domain-containing protein [Coleofasciculus sp. LEGE 07092]
MSGVENPCLSLAIARLSAAGDDNFAIWVIEAPYPGGYVHHDCTWSETLTQTWLAWQEMFSLGGLPHVPLSHHVPQLAPTLPPSIDTAVPGQSTGYGGRLMQHLGINLWEWLFAGSIQTALAESRGIARGQNKPLRLRLEIRHPEFIPLPWEIMQEMVGKPAISLSTQLLFSRTTSSVDSLEPIKRKDQALNILLVLGQEAHRSSNHSAARLRLEQEAATLENVFKASGQLSPTTVPCYVRKLLQPTPAELIEALDSNAYNILFYAGHGEPAADGGLLFLSPDATINGTELAQVLVRNQVTLAVFNACWGAQPDRVGMQTIPRSSLSEVLIQHGVPAVLGMRDLIADQEALSFIQALAQALAARMPIDQAVAVARQQLLTLYKFNQPAWTLPVLYMHPEFQGQLIPPIEEGITELPSLPTNWNGIRPPSACLRSLAATDKVWRIRGGLMRVGRGQENDLVIEEEMWVSYKHAEIICREGFSDRTTSPTYFLRDFSRNGTHILRPEGWQRIHHQEVLLQSGIKLKFGSPQGQTLEFVIEG